MTTRSGLAQRPGLVTFAAIVSLAAGGFHLLTGVSELANSRWVVQTDYALYSLFSAHLFWWGIFDLGIGVLAFAAGVAMLRGGTEGYYLGLAGAAVGATRWLFYIPAQPWLSLAIIALDLLVIHSLVKEEAFFAGT